MRFLRANEDLCITMLHLTRQLLSCLKNNMEVKKQINYTLSTGVIGDVEVET